MPTSLTATKIKDTYGQLLHVDGGVTSTLKTVYDGDGTATALKISTTAVEIPSFTLSGGTANGVVYLNGSKVATTGSALTFDGTKLGVGVTPQSIIGAKVGIATGGSNTNTVGTSIGLDGAGTQAVSGLRWTGTAFNGIYGGPYATQFVTDSADALATEFVNTGGTPFLWGISGSEQMRLTSTGLGIGTSSTPEKLSINGNIGLLKSGVTRIYNTQSPSDSVKLGGALNIEFETYSGLSWSTKLLLDNSGNLGLGVTPSAWGNTKAMQFTVFGAISVDTAVDGNFSSSWNAYATGSSAWKYTNTGLAASKYTQVYGQHQWHTAPSGTAGNAISFTQAMTLDASGKLAIGTTSSPAGMFAAVTSASGIAAQVGTDYASSGNTALQIGNYVTGTAGGATIRAYHNHGSTGNSQLAFEVNGTTEAMRIDSSGNVGIGTSSPAEKLDVFGQGQFRPITNTTGNSDWFVIGSIQEASNYGVGVGLVVENSGANAYGMTFGTRPPGSGITERMRIDSSGNLLVGTTSATFDNSSQFVIRPTANSWIVQPNACLTLNRSGSDGAIIEFYRTSTSFVGTISVTGSATAYNTSSDYRLKENIQPMQNALDVVAQLNPVTYTWKADGSDGQGFIAHELQAVVPDCVTGEKDAVDEEGKPVYQGVDTSFLVATLTKAIQEQQEQINKLTARVAQLEGN